MDAPRDNVNEGGITTEAGGSEEVAPCPGAAMSLSTDADNVKNSGAAGISGPGVFFERQGRSPAITGTRQFWQLKNSCWLFDGGFLGGPKPT
jgi:hypothetical protein